MFLGRVIGAVWCTARNRSLESHRMLLVQPLNERLEPSGSPIVCTDCVGAGAGELIYWCRAREASFPFLPEEVPTDATVVGIIDEVHLKPRKAQDADRRSYR